MNIRNAPKVFAHGILAFVMLFSMIGISSENVYASAAPIFVRVGLESNFLERDSIPIHSNNLAIGLFAHGHFQVSGFLTTGSTFQVQPNDLPFVRLDYVFHTLAEAHLAAGVYHQHGGVPAMLYQGFWGVYIPTTGTEHAQMLAASFAGSSMVNPSNRRVSIHTDGRVVLVSDNASANLQVQDLSGITSLGARSYRGVIEFGRFTGNRVTAVNIVYIEDYLLSVVPSEMPPSWHIEALKAQTVAARTFTVYRLGRFAARGFDLCDTTASQVYVGVTNEHPNSTLAVQLTRGIMIFHNGQPIEAVYSSSSGGVTENSENAWGSVLPYLRSVPDVHEVGAREWTRTITLSQLNQLLATQGINIGDATGVRLDKHANGRVQVLTILGTTGSHSVSREPIRWFFSPSLDSRNFTIVGGTATGGGATGQNTQLLPQGTSQGTYVRDTFGFAFPLAVQGATVVTATGNQQLSGQITIRGAFGTAVAGGGTASAPALGVASSVTSTGHQIVFSGRGWGHGVGMSQHGAHGMAQAGFNFREILLHYYTGVEIR